MDSVKKIIKNGGQKSFPERFSAWMTLFAGSTKAFLIAVIVIVVWALTGPLFNYSETWQLMINTGTTIITFLMVFLIQRAQNKESAIIQLKLNELIAAVKGASNHVLSIESLSEEDLETLKKFYKILASEAAKESNVGVSHSIEEAKELHERKKKYREFEDEESSEDF